MRNTLVLLAVCSLLLACRGDRDDDDGSPTEESAFAAQTPEDTGDVFSCSCVNGDCQVSYNRDNWFSRDYDDLVVNGITFVKAGSCADGPSAPAPAQPPLDRQPEAHTGSSNVTVDEDSINCSCVMGMCTVMYGTNTIRGSSGKIVINGEVIAPKRQVPLNALAAR